MNSYKILALTIVLAVLAMAAPDVQAAEKGRDIVIVMDSSRSLEWSDLENKREIILQALMTRLSTHGGDRIAIIRFAAWNETLEKGVFIYPPESDSEFPLKSMPQDPAARAKILEDIEKTLNESMKSFGRGTDLNVAFEKGLFPVLEARREMKSRNSLQVELIADGYFDVVENEVRDLYVTAAEKSGDVTRETLNRAAFEHFKNKVVPAFEELKDYALNITNPAAPNTPEDNDPFEPLGELAGVHFETKPEDSLLGTDEAEKSEKVNVSGKEEVSRPVHIYQGVTLTKFMISTVPYNSDFTVDILDSENNSIIGNPGVEIHGKGKAIRIFKMSNLKWGNYMVKIKNTRNEPTSFDISTLYSDFTLTPAVRFTDESQQAIPGKSFTVEISLLDTPGGQAVTDPALIADLLATLSITPPGEEKQEKPVSFSGMEKGTATVEIDVPLDIQAGKYEVYPTFTAVKVSENPEVYSYKAVAEAIEIAVQTVVSISFNKKEITTEDQTGLTGELLGKKAPDEIKALLVEKTSGQETEVTLKLENGTYRASLALSKPGTYEIKGRNFENYSIAPGSTPALTVSQPPFDFGEFISENLVPILIGAGVVFVIIIALLIYLVTRPKFADQQVVRLDTITRDDSVELEKHYLRNIKEKRRYATGLPGMGGAAGFFLKKNDACIVKPLGGEYELSFEDGTGEKIIADREKFTIAQNGGKGVNYVFFYGEPSREDLLKAAGIYGEPLGEDEFILEDEGFTIAG